MIYTVTFNPSLDYMINVNDFEVGKTNRTKEEYILAGGKGLNVSQVLRNLDVDTTVLGFVAGFTGEEIVKRMEQAGIKTDFVFLENGMSRINVKMINNKTEVNGSGPYVTEEKLHILMEKIMRLEAQDSLVLAGSIPHSLPDTIYQDIMKLLKEKEVQITVDGEGQLLKNVLPYHPFLIKPNHQELGALFQTEIMDKKSAVFYAGKLQEMGARNVLVSLGKDGAVLVDEEGGVLSCAAPGGEPVNAVGAGDSMVAGFLTGWQQTGDYKEAFYMGVAAGSASACSRNLASKEEITRLYLELKSTACN